MATTRKKRTSKKKTNKVGDLRGVVTRTKRPRTQELGIRGLGKKRAPTSKRVGFKGESIYAGFMDKMADLPIGKEVSFPIPKGMTADTWHTRLAQVRINAKIKPRPGFQLAKRTNDRGTAVVFYWKPKSNKA